MTRRRLVPLAVVAALLLGGTANAANPYPPPASGSGRVDPSRIRVGECAVFSGDGFAPSSAVAVEDNGAATGSARADLQGAFSKRLCYTSDAKRGRHVLTGTGADQGGQPLTVSATLIVEGVRQASPTTSGNQAVSGPADSGRTGTGSSAVSSRTSSAAGTAGAAGTMTSPLDVVTGDSGTRSVVNTATSRGGPFTAENSGLLRLFGAMLSVLLVLVLTWWLLLLARRRRERTDDKLGAATAGATV